MHVAVRRSGSAVVFAAASVVAGAGAGALDAADWPMAFALRKLLLQQCGMHSTTWPTSPRASRLPNAVGQHFSSCQRSGSQVSFSFLSLFSFSFSLRQESHKVMYVLTPIFSMSSSISEGRADANAGAAGKPTYLATPAMTETSWL